MIVVLLVPSVPKWPTDHGSRECGVTFICLSQQSVLGGSTVEEMAVIREGSIKGNVCLVR